MYKNERTDEILKILKKEKFTTVKKITNFLHYSPATIRRDLTYLANMGLIEKSYGGVCINENVKPMVIREHENVTQKSRIAKLAASLIKENETVFIDVSSTTSFMDEYLIDKNGITVITTNLKLASFLGEHKIETYCCGGLVTDHMSLSGSFTTEFIQHFHADKFFFSAAALSYDGKISNGDDLFYDNRKAMAQCSDETVFLCDSDKIGKKALLTCNLLSEVDYAVCDAAFPKEIIEKFPNVNFLW